MGNIVIWYSGSLAVVAYGAFLVCYLLRRRRCCYDITEGCKGAGCINNLKVNSCHQLVDAFVRFVGVGEVLLGGYLIHYVPFFFYDRTLFVHHYLSAYMYKLMLTAFVLDHIYSIARWVRRVRT